MPDSNFRLSWEALMTLCVIYYAIVVPLQMAFDVGSDSAIELFFNVLFVFDIGVNFVTAFKKRGVLIKDRREIANEYLRTWFWIDFISALPIDLLISELRSRSEDGVPSAETSNNNKALQMNKLFRMLRIFKLLRVVKIRRVFKRMEQYTKLNPSLVRLSKTLVVLVFAWHWIACM
jgi:hyperpolarization activated cyclic nucleotide-gated potassium channel 2